MKSLLYEFLLVVNFTTYQGWGGALPGGRLQACFGGTYCHHIHWCLGWWGMKRRQGVLACVLVDANSILLWCSGTCEWNPQIFQFNEA